MRVWDLPRQFADTGQEYPDFIQDARALAARLGIAHYVADERTAFKDIVSVILWMNILPGVRRIPV